jgi:hypothetical protein
MEAAPEAALNGPTQAGSQPLMNLKLLVGEFLVHSLENSLEIGQHHLHVFSIAFVHHGQTGDATFAGG